MFKSSCGLRRLLLTKSCPSCCRDRIDDFNTQLSKARCTRVRAVGGRFAYAVCRSQLVRILGFSRCSTPCT